MEQAATILAQGMKTTIIASPKIGSWHRLKRVTDQEENSVSSESAVGGKRAGGQLASDEMGTKKRVKHGIDHHAEPTCIAAEAVQQPRGTP